MEEQRSPAAGSATADGAFFSSWLVPESTGEEPENIGEASLEHGLLARMLDLDLVLVSERLLLTTFMSERQ